MIYEKMIQHFFCADIYYIMKISEQKRRRYGNLKKNIAVVQLDRPVEDTDLRTAVARAGFTVAGIEQMEA